MLHATSLEGFGYGDVVHQFKKRYKIADSSELILDSILWFWTSRIMFQCPID